MANLRVSKLELPGAVTWAAGPEDQEPNLRAVQVLERNSSRIFAAKIRQKLFDLQLNLFPNASPIS